MTTKFDIKQHMQLPETFKYMVTEVVVGEGGYHKIFRYDMKSLVKWTACMTIFSKGTVFTMDSTAVRTTVIMLLLLGLFASIALLCSIGDMSKLRNMEVEPLNNLASQVNAFVPFVLALFVSLTLSRWWALRVTALGKVFDSLANTCMIVASELNDLRWEEVRFGVMKYGMASVELLVQAARDHDEIDSLVEHDLLTPIEVEFMKEHELLWQRPMVMWAWIMHIITDAMDHNKTPAPSRQAVIGQCLAARDGMANINMYLDTQLPFAYVHLITLLVNVQNILMAIKSGLIFAKAVPDSGYFKMMQQVLSTAVIVFIYQALLTISYMIMDPFGDDVLDFPIRAYKAYVASIVDAMMGAGRGCPAVSSDGRLHRALRSKWQSKLGDDGETMRLHES
jgi:hypothetical protein